MKSLYSNLNLMSMVSALNEHFAAYFHEATRPMRSLLCGIVLAMLAFESIPSIRWMHRRFHLSLMPGSLNSYYRALKTCTVDDSSWVSHTIRMALSAIPSDLAEAPLFLSVDDTIVAKAGQCFDFVSKLFDHAYAQCSGRQRYEGWMLRRHTLSSCACRLLSVDKGEDQA